MTQPRTTFIPGKYSFDQIHQVAQSGPRVPRIDDAFVGTTVPPEQFTAAALSGRGTQDRPVLPNGNIRIVSP